MVLRFLDFELNDHACELRRGGTAVPIQPKAFRMLRHLADNADRVVSKDELLDSLWPGEAVSEASLTFCINAARRALGDSGADQRFIKSVRGHGYRFVAAVHRERAAALRPSGETPAAVGTVPAVEAGTAPLVGRAHELQVLDDLLDRLERGQSSVVLLEGEAGIGKTALLRECARRAASRGIRVLGGRTIELDSELPFWVWATALRDYVESEKPDVLGEVLGAGAGDLAKLLPNLKVRLPDLEAYAPLDPDQSRLRLFASMLGFLVRVSRREPLLVCIDDLHWADRSSLLLLQYLARELSGQRVMILGTHRELATDPNPTLAGVLTDFRRQSNVTFLGVSGLPREEVGQLLRGLLGDESAADSVVDLVVARSEGNPFFIEQLCRHFVDRGMRTGAGWREDAATALPPGIRELLGRRLQRFGARAGRILAIASVIGRQFSASLLQQVLAADPVGASPAADPVGASPAADGVGASPAADGVGASEDEVFAVLDDALGAHVIRDVSTSADRYEFSHALVQETLYAGILGARRLRDHRRVAEALEAGGADAADIAHHHLESTSDGRNPDAVAWARRAADAAIDKLAYEEAAHWYERLLERPGLSEDPRQRCEWLLALGTARGDCGQRAPSLHAYEQAAAIARDLGDAVLLARAALGVVYRRPTLRDFSFDVLEEALAILPAKESGLRAKLLSRSAVWTRQNPEGRPLCDQRSGEALELLASVDDPGIRAEVLVDLVAALWFPDRAPLRRRLIDELFQLSQDLRSGPLECWARCHLYWHTFEQGDVVAARAQLTKYTALAEKLRLPTHLWTTTVVSATMALVDGDFDRFDELHRAGLEVGQRIGEGESALASFAAQYFSSLLLRGGLGSIEPLMLSASSTWPSNPPERWWRPLVVLEAGRIEEARERFASCADQGFEDFRFETMIGSLALATFVAEACVRLGDAASADLLYRRLKPYADLWVVSSFGLICCGPVSHYLGCLAATARRWSTAAAHFETSLRQSGDAGAPAFLARTQASFAAMLRTRGEPGDEARARELLVAAAATSQRLGLSASAVPVEPR